MLLVHGLLAGPGTWWRVGPGLEARGWEVERATLPGHAGRSLGEVRAVADLADDVAHRHPGGPALVVGHSLGAVVALELAARHPAYAVGVVLEDPPGPGRTRRSREDAEERTREDVAALVDPYAAITELLHGHPTWTRRDARSVVEGRLRASAEVASFSARHLSWDLPARVAACPVPVGLVAASGRYSALGEPDRATLLQTLPTSAVTQVVAGHHVHLDAPTAWVDAVDGFGRGLEWRASTGWP
ncbi:MAG: hypothetical protein JWR42_1231 [Marmoricola sp.]|nr:hypothetical protein [Marmoricola sp.]